MNPFNINQIFIEAAVVFWLDLFVDSVQVDGIDDLASVWTGRPAVHKLEHFELGTFTMKMTNGQKKWTDIWLIIWMD